MHINRARAAIVGACALVLTAGTVAVVQAATPSKAVDHLCKTAGKTGVYYASTCKQGDTAFTIKGLKGADGADGVNGKDGAQGPAGDSAGIIKKCVSVPLNATIQSRPAAQRQVTIDGLPPYAAWSNSDLWANNVVAVNDGPGGVTLSNLSGLNDGSTEVRFQYNPFGFTGGESDTLKVCVARLSIA